MTVYHAVSSQTDDTPLITANGSIIDTVNVPRWVAVSKDLEDDFPLGSYIIIDCNCKHNGIWQINDRMNARWNKRIDILLHPSKGVGVWENVKITKI